MNPEPNYENQLPAKPGGFTLDKAYVGVDALLMIANTAWSFMLIPARTDETIRQMATGPNAGKGPSAETMQMIMMATTGGCTCMFLILYIFLWINMIKGRNWAFITNIVFCALGVVLSVFGLAGAGMPLAIFGMVTGAAKLVYNVMRVSGKLGPKPV